MDSLAPRYDDDFWFLSYHAMALSEDGQLALARAKIEQSLAANPNNAHGAHGIAHVCYESGERDAARSFLSSWLATYPDLTAEKLLEHSRLPLAWHDQRIALSFA